LQPHQAKTKLVTSSFFTSFLQSQSHCYKGCNHTATWFEINYILVCNCLFLFNRSTSVVTNTLQRMLQSPVVFGPGCNPSSKDHPSFNLTVSWHGPFFFVKSLL
jgi:hypothetical protein